MIYGVLGSEIKLKYNRFCLVAPAQRDSAFFRLLRCYALIPYEHDAHQSVCCWWDVIIQCVRPLLIIGVERDYLRGAIVWSHL